MVRPGSKRIEGTPEAHTGDVTGKGVKYVMAASGQIQYHYKQTNKQSESILSYIVSKTLSHTCELDSKTTMSMYEYNRYTITNQGQTGSTQVYQPPPILMPNGNGKLNPDSRYTIQTGENW
jgi:hypothetical protein